MKRHDQIIKQTITTLSLFFGIATTIYAEEEPTKPKGLNLVTLRDSQLLTNGERFIKEAKEDSALICFELLNSREPTNFLLYANSLYKAGRLYYQRNSFAKAMESYMKSLHICEEKNIETMLPLLYKDIGNIYSMFNDYERSSALYKKALDLARKQGNREFVNKLLSNIICAYTTKTSIKQYWNYYKEMSSHKETRPRYQYDLLMDKGMILSYEKKYREAIKYFKKTAEYSIAKKLTPINQASAYSSLADMYHSLGQKDSALYYLHKNKEISLRTNETALLIATYKNLTEVYENLDEQKSLEYKSKYLALSDSIFNLNEFNDIRNALFYYEMDNKQKAISSLTETNHKNIVEIAAQRRWIITLSILIVLILVLTVIAYKQYRKVQIAYRDLFNKSQEELATDKIYIKRIKELEERISNLKKELQKEETQPAGEAPIVIETTEEEMVGEEVAESAGTVNRSSIKLSEEQKSLLLEAILQVMEQTEIFCESDFSIERLAAHINSNTKYVSQVINDVYAKNFRTFLNEFRVKKAMMRMNDIENYGNYTIKAIAESVGYKSQSNFINVFTKQTGIKPSVFQKISKEEKGA